MSSEPVVRFDHVTKRFGAGTSGWRAAPPWSRPQGGDVLALDDIVLDVPAGQRLAIIGPNGAGKSTLLKVLAGVVSPTEGRVHHHGRIGAMIELGLGFHRTMSGRENVVTAATMLGLEPREARDRVDEISAFAGLEDVIDLPLREYSTGMVARLGFATATHCDADLLVVDEVLSVGDRDFQEQCIVRILDQVERGATLLMVSHDQGLVRSVAERVVLLRGGAVVEDGPTDPVVDSYLGIRPATVPDGPLDADLRDLTVRSAPLRPNTGVKLDVTLDVHRPVVHSLRVELVLSAPGVELVLCQADVALPDDLRTPGVHGLRVGTSPIPIEGGSVRLQVSALQVNQRVVARTSAKLEIAGRYRSLLPQASVDVAYSLTATAPVPATRARAQPVETATDPMIVVAHATKSFRSRGEGHERRRSRLVALDDVSLSIARGEAVGLIGPNGAGKSTLLRAVAGILRLDGGSVRVAGLVVPVLELGVGFRPQFDGWENLRVTAGLMGVDRSTLDAMLDEVVAFSGVADAMDRPVGHWSTGMRARLGFTLASHAPADVLLIDELLAVGDQEFRQAAIERVRDLHRAGSTVIQVSHDMRLVGETCDRVVHVERGRVVDDGASAEVIERYGATGWTAGENQGAGTIRIHGLRWTAHDEATPGLGRIDADIEVVRPAPRVRLDLSMRDRGADDAAPMSREKAEGFAVMTDVAAAEGSLAEPGWYHLEAVVAEDQVEGHGHFHAVVSAVDTIDGVYLAEAWVPMRWGTRDASQLPLGLGWEFEATVAAASTEAIAQS